LLGWTRYKPLIANFHVPKTVQQFI
jgi:hypothetical protein